METRLWHWILALALATLIHLLPLLWLGGGSGGEGAGRRFEGLSIILEPIPRDTVASSPSMPLTAAETPPSASAAAQPPAPEPIPPAEAQAAEDLAPISAVPAAPENTGVVTGELGDSGAVVIAETPLQPLAGGLEVAPPSTTLDAPPTPLEPAPTPVVLPPTDNPPSTPSPTSGPAPSTPSTAVVRPPDPLSDAPPGSGGAEAVAVDRGPLLGADRPAPEPTPAIPALEANTTDELLLPGASSETPDTVPAATPVEQVAVESAIPSPSPRSLDPAGVEEALEAVAAGGDPPPVPPTPTVPSEPAPENSESQAPLSQPTEITSETGLATEALAVPPPPGGDTLASTVSPSSEAILPAGPTIGETGTFADSEEEAIAGIATSEALEATAPETATALDASEVVLAEELAEDGSTVDAQPALPQVELQSRSAPAQSWADMLPTEMAARLPPQATDQDPLRERGDIPSLVVDGALSQGDASLRERYLASIQSWLARHKHYPHQARQQGLEGEARLRLVLNRFGEIQSHEFLRRTGHPLLDRAVEALLVQAAPLPPMPGFLADDELSMVVSISYRLQ